MLVVWGARQSIHDSFGTKDNWAISILSKQGNTSKCKKEPGCPNIML